MTFKYDVRVFINGKSPVRYDIRGMELQVPVREGENIEVHPEGADPYTLGFPLGTVIGVYHHSGPDHQHNRTTLELRLPSANSSLDEFLEQYYPGSVRKSG